MPPRLRDSPETAWCRAFRILPASGPSSISACYGCLLPSLKSNHFMTSGSNHGLPR
jgi:hypothetical protein